MGNSQPIKFEPALVEEAVFLTIKAQEDAGATALSHSFHQKRNKIYDSPQSEEKDRTFSSLYETTFHQLGLTDFFKETITEFSRFNDPHFLIYIKRVWTQKQRGAELYIDGAFKTIVLGLQVDEVLKLSDLKSFMRFEFLHIADMLDPQFQYTPNPKLGGHGDVEDNLIRRRFRILWDLRVAARLELKGHSSWVSLDKLTQDFEKAFSFLEEPKKSRLRLAVMESISQTQKKLIELSKDRRLDKVLGEGGLRCPLCEFSSYGGKIQWEEKEIPILKEIQKENPHWNPSSGLCLQCVEMYHAKQRVTA